MFFIVNGCGKILETMGAFHSIKNSKTFKTVTNGKEISLGKFPEIPRIVEFSKNEPFNRKLWKFREQNQEERKFPVKNSCVAGYVEYSFLGIPWKTIYFARCDQITLWILGINSFLFLFS